MDCLNIKVLLMSQGAQSKGLAYIKGIFAVYPAVTVTLSTRVYAEVDHVVFTLVK